MHTTILDSSSGMELTWGLNLSLKRLVLSIYNEVCYVSLTNDAINKNRDGLLKLLSFFVSLILNISIELRIFDCLVFLD